MRCDAVQGEAVRCKVMIVICQVRKGLGTMMVMMLTLLVDGINSEDIAGQR